jgi:hypothetical protein
MKIDNKAFSLFSFFSDICISGFVGVLTFFFCEAGNIEPLMTAVIVGISSHMGAIAIFLFQDYFICKYFSKHCEKHKTSK